MWLSPSVKWRRGGFEGISDTNAMSWLSSPDLEPMQLRSTPTPWRPPHVDPGSSVGQQHDPGELPYSLGSFSQFPQVRYEWDESARP